MPHRKLVKIGETPTLPTISQFLNEMAARQHEEIQRLKSEALSGKLPDPTVPEEHHEDLTPDPWQLHPVRIKQPAKKTSRRKGSAKRSVRAKATVKKAVKRTARPAAKKAPGKRLAKTGASSRGSSKRSKK